MHEHRAAVEYTLIQHGFRLRWIGTPELTVHDAVVILQLGAPPGSPLDIFRRGDAALWRLTEQLLAGIWDAVNDLAWMQSEDGRKNRNRPKRIPRPGVQPEEEKTVGTRMTPEEADEWLREKSPGWGNN